MSRRAILTPADCRTWLPPNDVVRLALGAYYAACRDIEPPPGEPFRDPVYGPYSDRETLRETFLAEFYRRVHEFARSKGLAGYGVLPDEEATGVQGQSPCGGAPDSGAGSSEGACRGAAFDVTALAPAAPTETRFFIGPELQDLPVSENPCRMPQIAAKDVS